jgi:hypothetical protein
VGGGASTPLLGALSISILKLPSNLGETDIFGSAKTKLRDSSWFAALGLVTTGRDNDNYSGNSFINLLKDLKRTIKSSVKQLLP